MGECGAVAAGAGFHAEFVQAVRDVPGVGVGHVEREQGLGAFSQAAIVSYDSSNIAVIRCEALDCPRCTFSYHGASER
jgi:L-aminopeptidase/D-esterase-like protein